MKRKVFVELSVDENVAIRNAETNGISSDGTIDYLEHEFGWLEQSGIELKQAMISDEDDTEDWGRYIDYVISWGFEHCIDTGAEYPKIMTYKEWKYNNGSLTNGDKIREMSDEELAEWINKQITDFAELVDIYFPSPYEHWLKWLKSEVKE